MICEFFNNFNFIKSQNPDQIDCKLKFNLDNHLKKN